MLFIVPHRMLEAREHPRNASRAQVNKLFTATPDGDAVPPQAPHILFRQFTGLTAAHGDAVRA